MIHWGNSSDILIRSMNSYEYIYIYNYIYIYILKIFKQKWLVFPTESQAKPLKMPLLLMFLDGGVDPKNNPSTPSAWEVSCPGGPFFFSHRGLRGWTRPFRWGKTLVYSGEWRSKTASLHRDWIDYLSTVTGFWQWPIRIYIYIYIYICT